MGTCGETRFVLAALGAAAVLLGAPACSSGDADGTDETRTPTHTAEPTAAPVRERACEAELSGAWEDALADGEVTVPDGGRAELAGLGPGAAWTVLQATEEEGERREVLFREGDEEPRQVAELADAEEHRLGGADFDGRWLVYDVVEGPTPDSPWTLYAWDVNTGRREVVAEAQLAEGTEGTEGTDGAEGAERRAVPGPLPQAVVRSGRLFWAQGTGGGSAAVYAQDLAGEGERRTVGRGAVDEPFAAGGLLVWLREDGPAKRPETRLTAVSMDTLEKAELPGPVARLRGVRHVASDGRTWAWAGGDAERPWLSVWREGWPKPLALVRGGEGSGAAEPELAGVEQVYVSGDVVTWRTTEGAWALDLRSRAYVRLTPRDGYALARDGGLGVAYTEEAEEAGASDVVRVVRTAELPPVDECG